MLEGAHGAGNGLARGADELADLFMGEAEAEARAEFGGLAAFAPIQQQAGEFFGRRGGQSHRAQLRASHADVAAELFCRGLIHLRMAREKAEEGLSTDVREARG